MVLSMKLANANRVFRTLADPIRRVKFERVACWQRNELPAIQNLINAEQKGSTMQIKLTSVFVDDQDKALKFYTEALGFVKKMEFTAGKYKWLTVVSPDEPEGVQLVLEPNANPAAKTFQQEIFRQGIPAANFFVGDVETEHARLKQHGVTFTKEPTKTTGSTIAVLDDTCGNLIQITHLDW
jgi:catechol 2,3-dioxygenase-like lactoylglutathione lyase family enzyme